MVFHYYKQSRDGNLVFRSLYALAIIVLEESTRRRIAGSKAHSLKKFLLPTFMYSGNAGTVYITTGRAGKGCASCLQQSKVVSFFCFLE